jgi:FkbM family methyltransferase
VQTTNATRRISLAVRRVRQTLTRFENGPSVLAGIVGSRIRHQPPELMYRLDDDLSIVCPNQPGARVPIYEIFAEDAYRLEWFTSDVDTPYALDVGGHIGCFALAFARLHPAARVETFEASPSTAEFTRRNMAINGFDDRVTVHQAAVSSSSGTLRFADNARGSGLNGLTAPEGTPTIEVPAVTFAEALASASGPVRVVKIDTEGGEYDIVLGSNPSDWSDVERVVMEFHPVDGHSWDELHAFFSKAGLEVVHQELGLNTDRLGTVWLSRSPLPQP